MLMSSYKRDREVKIYCYENKARIFVYKKYYLEKYHFLDKMKPKKQSKMVIFKPCLQNKELST